MRHVQACHTWVATVDGKGVRGTPRHGTFRSRCGRCVMCRIICVYIYMWCKAGGETSPGEDSASHPPSCCHELPSCAGEHRRRWTLLPQRGRIHGTSRFWPGIGQYLCDGFRIATRFIVRGEVEMSPACCRKCAGRESGRISKDAVVRWAMQLLSVTLQRGNICAYAQR